MMNDFLKFVKKTLLLALLVGLLYSPILHFNLVQDPFGIFRSDFTSQKIEPNNHFIKIKYLLNHPDKYDSFIMGNSRANNIDNTRIPDGKWYNLYYSLGFPREHLLDIELLEKNNVKIKNILLCLDVSSYAIKYADRENDLLRRPYPASLIELCKTYTEYIFQLPDFHYFQEVNSMRPNEIYKDLLASGRAINREREAYILNHPNEHIHDVVFANPTFIGSEDHVEESIKDIENIVTYCHAHSIQLKILLNPLLKMTYLENNYEKYFDFLKRLSSITDYYDFAGINKITSNNYFYYEASHFRPLVGDAMIEYVYYHKRVDSVPDFGFHVTQDNIVSHLEHLKNEIPKSN